MTEQAQASDTSGSAAHLKLSEELIGIYEAAGDTFTIGELIDKVAGRGYGLLLVVMPLPTALPFTPPGFTIPFGIVQIIIATQWLLGKKSVWMPDWVRRKKIISDGKASKMWSSMPRFLAKFEKLMKPRLPMVFWGAGPKLMAIAVLLASLAMMVPFPVTNSICAIGIMMIGLGLLEEDGWFGIVGSIISLLSFVLVFGLIVAVFFFGFKGIKFDKWF